MICWNCRFFEHNNAMGTYAGLCRRHAPCALDVNQFGNAETSPTIRLQAGLVDGGTIYKAAATPTLFLEADSLPTAVVGQGYLNLTVWPFLIPPNYWAKTLVLCASIVNTGAASVGTAPSLTVRLYQVNSDTLTSLGSVDVIFDPSDCGVEGNINTLFVKKTVNFAELYPNIGNKLIAPAIELVDDDPEKISEIQSPMIAIECVKTFAIDLTSSPFPWIVSGNTFRCGEFENAVGVIPPLP